MQFFRSAAAAALMFSLTTLASDLVPTNPTISSFPSLKPKKSFFTVSKKEKCMVGRKHGRKNQDLYRHVLLTGAFDKYPEMFRERETRRLFKERQVSAQRVQRSTSVPKQRSTNIATTDTKELKKELEQRSLTHPRERPGDQRQHASPSMPTNTTKTTTVPLQEAIQAAQSMAQMFYTRQEHMTPIRFALKIIEKYTTFRAMESMSMEEFKICLACAYLVDIYEVLGKIYPGPVERSGRVQPMYRSVKERFMYLRDLKSRIFFSSKTIKNYGNDLHTKN